MMKLIFVLLSSLIGASQVGAQTHAAPATPVTSPDAMIVQAKRQPAPDFSLMDARGQTIKLSAYKGKVVLLDFWATWCGGCKLELPWYVEFDREYRGRGLAVIGVSMDDGGMKVVKPFLEEKQIDYPVVIGNEQLGRRFGLNSMPMTLLIDKQGKVAVTHSGVVNKVDFERHIQELLTAH